MEALAGSGDSGREVGTPNFIADILETGSMFEKTFLQIVIALCSAQCMLVSPGE